MNPITTEEEMIEAMRALVNNLALIAVTKRPWLLYVDEEKVVIDYATSEALRIAVSTPFIGKTLDKKRVPTQIFEKKTELKRRTK